MASDLHGRAEDARDTVAKLEARLSESEWLAPVRDFAVAHFNSALGRVRYFFAPPGFSHDRSRKDSHTIKADFLREHPEEAGTEGLIVSA